MKFHRIALLLISITFVTNTFAQNVYVTKTGEKYHTETCRYLKYSKKEITLQKAFELGYTACSVCKPASKLNTSKSQPISQHTTSSQTNSSNKKATSTQCTGITKSGARCKRMTTNANGKCYQH